MDSTEPRAAEFLALLQDLDSCKKRLEGSFCRPIETSQPKFLAAKSQLASLSKNASTNLGRALR